MPPVQTSDAGVLHLLDAYAAATLFVSRVLLDSPDGLLLTQLSAPEVLLEWPFRAEPHLAGVAALAVSMAERESLEQLHADHRRLFLGPEHVLACPYESVYLNDEHLTFGSQTLDVRRWYRRYGLRAPAETREPDDHIGLELAFVSHVCVQALEAADGGDGDSLGEHIDALGEFLSEHLLLWADDCVDHITDHAETHFYRGVGLLTRGVVGGLEQDLGL